MPFAAIGGFAIGGRMECAWGLRSIEDDVE